ncbi:MAG: DUF4900 domain-containing protein [Thermotogae bacterium]|nr:DUF4900 domain-containing protein [Thermotogota bacterium]
MKKGFVLPLTLLVVATMSILTTTIVLSLSSVTLKNRHAIEASLERVRSMNALQFGLSVVASKARGLEGFEVSYDSTSPTWVADFVDELTNRSDGAYWQSTLAQVGTGTCFYISQQESLRDLYNNLRDYLGPGAEVVALPFQDYDTLSLVVAKAGNRYSFAVVSTYFLNRYAYFTEREDNPYYGEIWFTTGDVIDGPFRSNDQIRVHGEPVFKGSVEVYDDPSKDGTGVVYHPNGATPVFYDPYSPRLLSEEDRQRFNMELLRDQYENELETMVAAPNAAVESSQPVGLDINLPSDLMLVVEFKSAPGEGQDHWLKVYTLDKSYYPNKMNKASPLFHLKPNPDGTWHLVVTGDDARSLLGLDKNSEHDFLFNGVIKSNQDIAIDNRGNAGKPTYVDGKYTIYSEDDIFIHTHIIYEDYRDALETMAASEGIHGANQMDELQLTEEYNELLKDVSSDDFLNIVAKDSVVIVEKKENLKIFGSVYAFDGSFEVYRFYQGSPTGQLTVYGSLMQNYRGPVGTFDPDTGEVETGYVKNYVYDWRILGGLGATVKGTPSARGRLLVLTVLGVN